MTKKSSEILADESEIFWGKR